MSLPTEHDEAVNDDFAISEPKHKSSEHYLRPNSWHGDLVPEGLIGPWGLGQTCWYVTVEGGGWRKTFAAETAERAQEAARAWIEEHRDD